MRFLFYGWEYPPCGSGIGQYVQTIARALSDAGHTVFVAASRCKGAPAEESIGTLGKVLRVYDDVEIGKKSTCAKVLEIARKFEVDVIEAPDHLGEAAELLRLDHRPPVVVKMHYNDVLPRLRYAQAQYRWQRLLIDAACFRERKRISRERESIENADALISPCLRIREELRKHGLKIPDRFAIVPNPISPVPFKKGESKQPTILIVGRTDMGKGIGCLPNIMDRVASQYPNATLEIVGTDSYARFVGSTQKWLRGQMKNHRFQTKFMGYVDPGALEAAFSRAWVVIVPSRWDTFPTVVLEAMARGKAIVASPHGGMPEMLKDTGNRIADPETEAFSRAVIEMIGDKRLRRAAGASGFEKAATVYHPETIARQYIETLKGWL